jgi:transposase
MGPELGPGDVVVLDKLTAHKTDRVRELVEATGARLAYLPGYSPDFNAIEHARSKLKALLRKAGARTLRKLRNALRWALLEIHEQRRLRLDLAEQLKAGKIDSILRKSDLELGLEWLLGARRSASPAGPPSRRPARRRRRAIGVLAADCAGCHEELRWR